MTYDQNGRDENDDTRFGALQPLILIISIVIAAAATCGAFLLTRIILESIMKQLVAR